jgi:hypothetical protein
VLNPDLRHLLTDGLRPPTGWRIDAAIATTYTLDLTSLLLAPLSMAAYDQSEGGIEGAAPHELLEAIRRYAERTTVFCQAGGIHVPSTYRKLTVFAEDSVVEVAPPPGRVFHPKVWLLRFTNPAGAFTHRLLVLSRNLTGDRSWDTVLMTEEDASLPGQMPATPTADFINALTEMTVRPLSDSRRELLEDMARTVRGRSFGVPKPFTAGHLMAIGTGAQDGWPVPAQVDRCVVISPFLDVGTIRRLPAGSTIVSRPEAFDRVGAAVLDGHDLRVLQPHADAPEDEIDFATDDAGANGTSRPFEVKSGLHAKVLAWDIGDSSRLLTGSANATSAAFGGNIEFGVLLEGRPGTGGAAAILKDSDKETGFSRLLQPYVAKDQPEADLEFDLEREIEEFHVALAAGGAAVHVSSADDGAFALRLTFARQPAAVGHTWVRPVTLRPADDRPMEDETTWEGRGYNDVTPFIALRTRLERDGVSVERASVIRADLFGAPDDRARRVLRELLKRVEDVLRYLALLLQDPSLDDVAGQMLSATNDDDAGGSARWAILDDLVLLEPLVRAYARGDDSLDRVERLLDDLRDDDGKLPELGPDFHMLWQVLVAAKETR